MASEVYKRALRLRSELQEQLRKVDDFITSYQQFMEIESKSSELLGDTRGVVRVEGRKSEQKGNKQTSNKRAINPKPALVIEHVKRILRARQRPMTRSQLLKALAEREIIISGSDPAKVLGTNLWRSREIEKAREGGYWIKGEPRLPGVGPSK